MTAPRLSFTLGQEEATLLTRLLNCPTIPGLNGEVMATLSEKEIGLILTAAEHSLSARGFLRITEAGQPEIDPVVVSLVGGCASPDLSFLATCHTAAEEVEACYYHVHLASQVLVEHSFPGPHLHTFTALKDQKELIARIAAVLRLEKQLAPQCPSGRICQEALSKAREQASTGELEKLVASLLDEGLAEATAEEMAQTLSQPLTNGSITFVHHAQEQILGFATLEGSNGLWLLTPEGDESGSLVSLEPTSAREAYGRVQALCTSM